MAVTPVPGIPSRGGRLAPRQEGCMGEMKVMAVLGAALGMTALTVCGIGAAVRAADHGDSPQVRKDTRVDINDVYIFTPGGGEGAGKLGDATDTVMIMTVCPLAGITGPKIFAPDAKYEFAIDTDGDAAENQV